ncbi:MAG: winged helix-turn-helix domain-containing protein [Bacteroides sp.]|nr:winged helix-turn-helix domain-containing protein [Bacteroides sp.]
MNKIEIGLNAGKIWHMLYDYGRWNYDELKEQSGMRDRELNAALGWLAREDKIEFFQEGDRLFVSLGVNVYIG